jgi:D-allose transport system substrate-binding protein
MKRFSLWFCLIALVATVLTGCGSSPSSTDSSSSSTGGTSSNAENSSSSKSPKVAVVLKTLSNPFWVSMKEGIEAEAQKQGVTVDIFAASAEDDLQGQLKLFEDLLNKDYQGIAVAPLSPVNLIPAIVEANKKGIYLVNIDEKIDMNELKNAGGYVYAFVTTDNEKVGAKGAKAIIEKLGAAGGEVAIVEGKAGNASGEARKTGAEKAFTSNPAIKLVASQPADWDRSKALDVTTNLLQRFPNLKAIYCANDTMALGALQAVENAGKGGQVLVVGTDGTPEAVQSVKDGKLFATVAQDPAQIGATSLQKLLEAVKQNVQLTKESEPVFVAVDSNLITK